MATSILSRNLPRPVRFSYASDELSRPAQTLVKLLEACTGQPLIMQMYDEYAQLRRPPEMFWVDAVAALRLDLRIESMAGGALPRRGPLVVIANHRFGVVDGIVLG